MSKRRSVLSLSPERAEPVAARAGTIAPSMRDREEGAALPPAAS
jgi:hypothetical protein